MGFVPLYVLLMCGTYQSWLITNSGIDYWCMYDLYHWNGLQRKLKYSSYTGILLLLATERVKSEKHRISYRTTGNFGERKI